ncbi:MAG TPA: NYN domain-containing protein [Ilumatobacter sp.]|nr:NYN domain-containing protein [Ilumatobacter sp.]
MNTAIVYIDALNLYYGAVRRTDNKWLDVGRWARSLVPDCEVTKVRYFTARIKQRDPSDRARDRQNVYLRALEADPLMDVTYGHFRSDPRWKAIAEEAETRHGGLFRPPLVPADLAARVLAESRSSRSTLWQEVLVLVEEEKGSDVNLGVHLIHDVLSGGCQTAVVVTNDSDLEEAVRLASQHVEVVVVNPSSAPTNARLLRHAAREIPFQAASLADFHLPSVVRARNGRELHRPREWRKMPEGPLVAGPPGPSDDADG